MTSPSPSNPALVLANVLRYGGVAVGLTFIGISHFVEGQTWDDWVGPACLALVAAFVGKYWGVSLRRRAERLAAEDADPQGAPPDP